MENELKEFKCRWRNLNSLNVPDTFCSVSKVVTRRQSLVRFFRVLTIISAIYVVLGPVSLYELGMPLWLDVVVWLFFVVMSLLCYRDLRLVKKIDFGNMSIVQLLSAVERFATAYVRQQIASIPVALIVVSLMLYCFSDDVYALIGGVAGGIIGGIIGFVNDRKVRRYIREIREELMSAADGNSE